MHRRSLLLALTVAASSAVLVLGPLRPWLTPPPVAGIKARLSADGRLLGHAGQLPGADHRHYGSAHAKYSGRLT